MLSPSMAMREARKSRTALFTGLTPMTEDQIKLRKEESVLQAQAKAKAHGTDATSATMDLMCSFILMSVKNGADPDKARDAVWEQAKSVVADFWPDAKPHWAKEARFFVRKAMANTGCLEHRVGLRNAI
jgi:hypothetical protein